MATKRKSQEKSEASNSKKTAKHWTLGLLSSMNDPELVIKEDEKIVIIKDKFPKAKYHFLILPKEDIPSLKKVSKKDVNLLKYMHSAAEKLIKSYPKNKFKLGYHSVASMARLHLHVISDDFNSSALKTKKHWNSFNTEFFISSEVIINQLEKDGKISVIPESKAKSLMDLPLKCHKCSLVLNNMPKLKQHLIEQH